jgi:uncharacterized protein
MVRILDQYRRGPSAGSRASTRATSSYKHGVTYREVPTSIVAPVVADSGIPVIVVTAPIHLAANPAPVNKPRIYFSYAEAVAEMGFIQDKGWWNVFTACRSIYTYFALYNIGPIILINVYDPSVNFTVVPPAEFTLVGMQVTIARTGIIRSSVIVRDQANTITYIEDVDYALTYDAATNLIVTALPGQGIAPNDTLSVSFNVVNPSAITKDDIIGGVDINTGQNKGIAAVEDVFPLLRVVPGILMAPRWSYLPEVAMVLASACYDINGCFNCSCYVDIDSTDSGVTNPMDVYAFKQSQNYVDMRMLDMWPRCGINTILPSGVGVVAGESPYPLSEHYAALTEFVDRQNGDVPVETPSNKGLKINQLIVGSEDTAREIVFSKALADSMNGQGICTAINWMQGWVAWGSNMSVYPGITDPKDRWLPVRRMTDWLGNTLVLTFYQKVDKPGNRRLIDSIVDTANVYLNGLVADGNCLGARIEFRHDENPDTELIDGHYVFHVYEAFPIPAEWIEFILEFDINYLNALFLEVA